MRLTNHIAHRFLYDSMFQVDILRQLYPEAVGKAPNEWPEDKRPEMEGAFHLISSEHTTLYYVTNSVLENLELLKVDYEENGHYNWKVFNHLFAGKFEDQAGKITFIFPDNFILRCMFQKEKITFLHMELHKTEKKEEKVARWVIYRVNTITGEITMPVSDQKTAYAAEKFCYALFCFMFLTENDEVILPPGKSTGTRRTGKIINELKAPLTIVNSRWNTTVIRQEGFVVSGHFRLQPCGEGRMDRKLIFIEPFEKKGYTRTAKSISDGIHS